MTSSFVYCLPPNALNLTLRYSDHNVILFIHILSVEFQFERRIRVLVTKSHQLYHLYGPRSIYEVSKFHVGLSLNVASVARIWVRETKRLSTCYSSESIYELSKFPNGLPIKLGISQLCRPQIRLMGVSFLSRWPRCRAVETKTLQL